jgi:ankyrin repeat protein
MCRIGRIRITRDHWSGWYFLLSLCVLATGPLGCDRHESAEAVQDRDESMSGQRLSAEEIRRATASMRASISEDDAAGVEEAIRRGAVPDEGLHFAVKESSPECVQALLQFVSDVDVRTEMYADTALSVASFYSTPDMVRLLLDAGADPDGAPDDVEEAAGAFVSPLAQVVLRASLGTSDVDSCQQIVVALIERGASTDVELAGVPILIEAIESVPPMIVEALLEGGADPLVYCADRGGTALDVARQCVDAFGTTDSVEIARLVEAATERQPDD